MPLQGDQRALLQLLCERGQSYEDISGLLGVTPAQVREQARAALTEIGGADPDQEVGLTDFLLGQADPIGRADAIRHLQSNPDGLELSARIQSGLREIAPAAKQPNLPEPRGRRRRAALPEGSETPGSPPAGVGGDDPVANDRAKLFAALAVAGLILVAILAFAGVFSGSDTDGDPTSAPTATTPSEGTAASGGDNITELPLEPTAGSGVAGRVTFGLLEDQQLFVDVEVQGLDPDLPESRSYLIWLIIGETENGYPIDLLEADENGSFSGRLSVPTAIAVAVGNQARSVRVSSTPVEELQSEIERAAQQEVPVLPFVGTELASGEIPLVRGNSEQPGG